LSGIFSGETQRVLVIAYQAVATLAGTLMGAIPL
jgi:hypothetical protein